MTVIRPDRQRIPVDQYNEVKAGEDRWPDPEHDEHAPGDWYEVSGANLHVVPVFVGERKHEASPKCWCKPRKDTVERGLYLHHRRAES